MPDSDARLASDLSLAVMRLARQLRFRNPSSPVSLSQLSALATLANEGAMTPGALAIRERVRPPSMTRVIASLAEEGFVDRSPHPVDGRQWRAERLATLDSDKRATLREAADLMLALVDESP